MLVGEDVGADGGDKRVLVVLVVGDPRLDRVRVARAERVVVGVYLPDFARDLVQGWGRERKRW